MKRRVKKQIIYEEIPKKTNQRRINPAATSSMRAQYADIQKLRKIRFTNSCHIYFQTWRLNLIIILKYNNSVLIVV